MDALALKVSDIISNANTYYRVIFVSSEMCVLCLMNCSNLNLLCIQTTDLLKQIGDGIIFIHQGEGRKVVDIDAMLQTAREKFLLKRNFIREIEEAYAPTFLELSGHAKKVAFNEITEKFNLPRNSAWRYIRLYLQSGMDENVLLSNTRTNTRSYQYREKTGRRADGIQTGIVIDKQTEQHFQEALNYYKSGRSNTMKNAFDQMNLIHYMTMEINTDGHLIQRLMPASERPTFRQFEYYVKKNLSAEEKDRIKTSAQEQRNNKRLLLSDNLKNVMGPGDCIEMDEVEVDISLVSQIAPDQTVGRPIVYAMIDVYTRAIVSVSIAFDNNSVRGLTNCLMALAEDKVALCAKYGLEITPEIWPSNFIPRTIRADRGSEYRSKEAKRIFNELNVNLELVPGGSGSLKGSVEQWFHQLHSAQNPLLERKGLIQKRHDSKHHQEAALTIEDFKKILYNFVVTHNLTYMKNYPLTHDMIAQKVQPIPSALWQYGESVYGALRPIVNKDQFLYTLLQPVTAKLSRRGITYKGLYYMDFSDFSLRQRMYAQGEKTAPLEMRIDPRNVGALYMLDKQGHLKKIPLNVERTGNNYQGMSLAEYLDLLKAKKERDKAGGVYNEELRVGLLAANENAIAMAEERTPRYANTKNIREARTVEKSIESAKIAANKELIDGSLLLQKESVPSSAESNQKPFRIPMTVDEAFDLFNEDM